jgi:hypothetical protein
MAVVFGLWYRNSSLISSKEHPLLNRLVASECRNTCAPVCEDLMPACFKARIVSVEIARRVLKADMRRPMANEQPTGGAAWPVSPEIVGNGFSNIDRQWQENGFSTFAANGDPPFLPIDVI